VALLSAMRAEAGGRGPVSELPDDRHLARALRGILKAAGIDRAELFATDATRKNMTWYDLRATGITWMAIRGDDPLKIMARAGHEDFATTQGYIREVEAVREGFGDVFPPLPPCLLHAPNGAPSEGGECPPTPGESSRESADGGLSTRNDCGGAGNRTRVRKASS
jgi:hypothetical protein